MSVSTTHRETGTSHHIASHRRHVSPPDTSHRIASHHDTRHNTSHYDASRHIVSHRITSQDNIIHHTHHYIDLHCIALHRISSLKYIHVLKLTCNMSSARFGANMDFLDDQEGGQLVVVANLARVALALPAHAVPVDKKGSFRLPKRHRKSSLSFCDPRERCALQKHRLAEKMRAAKLRNIFVTVIKDQNIQIK